MNAKFIDMDTRSEKKSAEKSWILPGTKLTHKEFMEGVKKAEEGPFMTIEEFERDFSKWKKEKGYC
jgi:hypothetical protein